MKHFLITLALLLTAALKADATCPSGACCDPSLPNDVDSVYDCVVCLQTNWSGWQNIAHARLGQSLTGGGNYAPLAFPDAQHGSQLVYLVIDFYFDNSNNHSNYKIANGRWRTLNASTLVTVASGYIGGSGSCAGQGFPNWIRLNGNFALCFQLIEGSSGHLAYLTNGSGDWTNWPTGQTGSGDPVNAVAPLPSLTQVNTVTGGQYPAVSGSLTIAWHDGLKCYTGYPATPANGCQWSSVAPNWP